MSRNLLRQDVMVDLISLGLAMTIGQGADPLVIPSLPPAPPAISRPSAPTQVIPPSRIQAPAVLPPSTKSVPALPTAQTPPPKAPEVAAPAAPAVAAPVVVYDAVPEAPAEEPAEEPSKGFFMSMLDGTSLGKTLDDRGLSISGWTQMSYTASQANISNLPVTWNDRANRFLMQQTWLRIDKAIDTESKERNWGFRVDGLFGTDYRFTMIRGLFNGQLNYNRPDQNLYGFDLPQFYVNAWLPNLFQGTELKIGRMYTPWGVESVEGPSSPLLSRSYAFNWAPPFFHMGVSFASKFSDTWSGLLMFANGNDVFIDKSQEFRIVGNLAYVSCDKKDKLTFAASIGRGKFNTGDRFAPTTLGLMSEDGGRNNINVFDIVWSHQFTDDLNYSVEAVYGYQYGVPSVAQLQSEGASGVGGIVDTSRTHGNANWASLAQYLTYNWTEKVSTVLRFELFDDFQGQRTGFEGLYTSTTFGIQFKPTDAIMIRPEIRYDHNDTVRAFDGGTRNGLWTASTDLIFKW
jgi:hypothetical protein